METPVLNRLRYTLRYSERTAQNIKVNSSLYPLVSLEHGYRCSALILIRTT